jgi:hypothetical protein
VNSDVMRRIISSHRNGWEPMDKITKFYIFSYFSHLMTPQEKVAHRSMVAEAKVAARKSFMMKRFEGEVGIELASQSIGVEQWISSDPEIRALLANGPDAFITAVCDRLLREEQDKIYFNRCPRCQAVTRTPTAKQCPKCFFSWHDSD